MLLKNLIQQNVAVEIIDGRLVTTPEAIELDANDRALLAEQIANFIDSNVFTYCSYTTGSYGRGFDGVTLQFENIQNFTSAYAIFNADIKRVRTTKSGKKGARLPKGQFRVAKRSNFVRFWQKCSLKMPNRLSVFHDYMGNLKSLLFVASYSKGERLDCSTIKPANIPFEEILKCLTDDLSTDKIHTSSRQEPYINQTKTTDKEINESHTYQGIHGDMTTGTNKCGKRLIRKDGLKESSNISITSSKEELTVNNTCNNQLKKRPEDQTTDEWLREYSGK